MTGMSLCLGVVLVLLNTIVGIAQDETCNRNNDDEHCTQDLTVEEENDSCGIYYAKSTLPGAGLGMFAGKNFVKGAHLMPTGDIVIPLIDQDLHHTGDRNFLWNEYTWEGLSLLMDHEGISEVNVVSPGFGAAANSFIDLANVDEWNPKHEYAGLTRDKDPGAGSISPYHDRKSTAKTNITTGQELFVNYGDGWFESRVNEVGAVPITGDLTKANMLLRTWSRQFKTYEDRGQGHIYKDLWESFVWKNPFNYTSRTLFALPKNWQETDEARNSSVLALRKSQATRSLEWLQEFGACADNLRAGASTIPQAGRGAFAQRNLSKGSLVAPLPLVHVPHSNRLNMHKLNPDPKRRVKKHPKEQCHVQLLVNYCMGHNETSLLLCPYGMMTLFINHSREPNVKLVWASTTRSNHHPEWLNLTIEELDQKETAGLAMELIALRNINKDEEIFLDYGDKWQQAWDTHVAQWSPGKGNYTSAEELNKDTSSPLRTEFEQLTDPYPSNLQIRCNVEFQKSSWKKHHKNRTMHQFVKEADGYMVPCEVLRFTVQEDGELFYTAVFNDTEDTKKPVKKLIEVPRDAFTFVDRPYTSNLHMPGAFRHAAVIPEHLLPEKWRNLQGQNETNVTAHQWCLEQGL